MKLINEISKLAWEILTEVNSWTSYNKVSVKKPEIIVKDNRRGTYRRSKNLIILPKWIFDEGEYYLIYYIVHELTHVFWGDHGRIFKEAEAETLDYFGIKIKYGRAYAKRLTVNGKVVYERPVVSIANWRTANKYYLCETCRADVLPGMGYVAYARKAYCDVGCFNLRRGQTFQIVKR